MLAVVLSTFLVFSNATFASVTVSVASNFQKPFLKIKDYYENSTGKKIVPVFGSTGALYTQIVNGAPFDLFLSADELRPKLLIESGRADGKTFFTYALGQLAYYQPHQLGSDLKIALKKMRGRVAIANPALAPFGRAAVESLKALHVLEAISVKTVTGKNVSQAMQFVDSGAAFSGFVSASQVVSKPSETVILVDPSLYRPIRQTLVMLSDSTMKEEGKEFINFLIQDPAVKKIILTHGYRLPGRIP